MSTATTKALVVKLTATPETREEVAGFLAGAVTLANAEPGTTVWYALRTDESTFWIVDAFPGPLGATGPPGRPDRRCADGERRPACWPRRPRSSRPTSWPPKVP